RDEQDASRAAAEAEYARVERELRARAEELLRVREQLAARDAAIRELSYSLEAAESSDAAAALLEARARGAGLAALNGALAAEAARLVEENDLLRERPAQLEGESHARRAVGADASPLAGEGRAAELERGLEAARAQLAQSGSREAAADDA